MKKVYGLEGAGGYVQFRFGYNLGMALTPMAAPGRSGTSGVGDSGPREDFFPTRWSVVLAAGGGGSRPGEARRALSELAQTYWFPLYAYLRRRGRPAEEAEDLTQEFFGRLLENNALARVDRSKGRFRAFLLASLKHFLANEGDKARAKKRGGGRRAISLDALDAEARYHVEPVNDMTPERVFERRWALAVLDAVLGRLREEYAKRGRAALFAALENVLVKGEGASHAEIARHLGTTAGAVKVAGHRLRRRYRELLREEIGQTVAEAGLVDEEIQTLMASL